MIKDILILDNDIKSSINLNLDFKDRSKTNSYIVTYKSVEIINEIIKTFNDNSKNKAKLLTGPYGKGKSHLALYIAHLLSNSEKNPEDYKLLLKKSNELGENAYNLTQNFIESQDKYLPVILNSTPYNKSFTDILVYSLKNALINNGIDDLRLDFYFEKAVEKIEAWQDKYETTFNQFTKILGEDAEEFKNKLHDYDINAYNKFKKIYMQLTAGEEFKPYMDIHPIKIYEKTCEKIKEKGYKGIFILYDEFSKYIEYLVSKNDVLDIKLLQDFAEFCNRSKDDTKVVMMLISHKSIGQYTDKADKSNVDNWRGIEGRFDEINYNDFSNQQYEIISYAIKKDEKKWNKYKSINMNYFMNLIDNYDLRRLFTDLTDEEYKEWIINGAYPLHPIASYCLPRISERVAQNERTLFTFLCKNENNTLIDYVTNHNEEVKLDAIFDFFEEGIENLGKGDEIYKILKRTNIVLQNIEDELEIKVIKSIAIIQMINNFSLLKPGIRSIKQLYGEKGEEVLIKLIKENHLIHRKLSDAIDISSNNDIEVFNEIQNIKENNKRIDINKFLNDNFKNLFIESKSHNDRNCIIRYFKIKFIGSDKNNNYIIQDLNEEPSDGIVYITENPISIDESLDVIFIKNVIDSPKLEIIKDLYAIKLIKSKKDLYSTIKSEIDSLEAQYENNVVNYLNKILQMRYNNEVYYQNKLKKINNKRDLSKLVSKIMDNVYERTPIINNEMINKTEPSSVVLSSRTKVIDQIIQYAERKEIVFRKGSLEATIMRAVLKVGVGLSKVNDETYLLDYNVLDKNPADNFTYLLIKIDKEIKKALNTELNMSSLYELMTSKSEKFGVKKGVIPLILAYSLSKYKKYLSIFNYGNEVVLNSETLINIDKNPEKYSIRLEEFTHEKEVYLNELQEIFSEYINENDKRYDSLNYIIIAIKRWFLYLSKYARNTKRVYLGDEKYEKLSKADVKLKNKLRTLNENSIKFLFEELLMIFETNSYKELIEKLSVTKCKIDNLTNSVCLNIEKDIKRIFNLKEEVSVNNGLSNWKDGLSANRIYTNNLMTSLLDVIDNHKDLNNLGAYLNKLSNCLLGIYVSDWNDDTPTIFISKLKELKKDIDEFHEQNDELQSQFEIAATQEIELSNRAEMLFEDLKETLEDYSSYVSGEEKQYIILELLKHI
ncbi:hypothetical protein [Terrisporobacter hibernicus]|uniref:Uncharacterized protein n=1 Tax=Terrisporobacter hibernicus TaxID=2813371 RepID=A0AAX2ZDJ6_9FIRM|nr:hypothetical protein [Terrisporobacter hibernicus]UEL46430.1 hypothetical protein JW646_12330 [Terrisporobacter hibernicus]